MTHKQAAATKLAFAVLLAWTAGVLVGCRSDRPPLSAVEGVVTLDGKPLADAEVVFTPQNGRHSTARTDGQGRYELTYLPDVEGAMLGSHSVRISQLDPDMLVEKVPAKFNADTTLTAEVSRGSNEINFELKSD